MEIALKIFRKRNAGSCSAEWQIHEIRTVEEIESIRPIWEAMQAAQSCPVINADIDRYLSVVNSSENIVSPLILLLKHYEQPQAMIIGRLEKHPVPIRLGYKTIIKPNIRCLTVVYGGVIGTLNEQICVLLVAKLIALLRISDCDAIYLSHLRTESLFYQIVNQRVNFWCRNHFRIIQPHRRMSIPDSIDAFYNSCSKKHRGNLRRSIKHLEGDYPDTRIIYHIGKDGIDSIVQECSTLSRLTYQHQLQAGFENNNMTRSILSMDSKLNRILVSILYIEGSPVAFQWGTRCDNTYYLEKIGYNHTWSAYGVGTILFLKTLDCLTQDKSVKHIDFGFGDAEYKQSYCDESWYEAAATYIYAPRIYPILINILDSVNSALTIGLAWIARETNMFSKIKRIWRRKLQKTTPSKPNESSKDNE